MDWSYLGEALYGERQQRWHHGLTARHLGKKAAQILIYSKLLIAMSQSMDTKRVWGLEDPRSMTRKLARSPLDTCIIQRISGLTDVDPDRHAQPANLKRRSISTAVVCAACLVAVARTKKSRLVRE